MPGISDSVRVSKQIRSLPELMIALRERTKLRGQKAALARDLKVTRQAIDQWLSGNAKPSAEIMFELLKRVEQQERQK
jgi:transcriptional regulator with XRE-family HTH domain